MPTIGTLKHVNQWTLGQARQMPLYQFAVDDGAGTELYVQPQTGEIVTLTTARSRAMAWISTIPHWLYFTALRTNQSAWYKTVVWTSAFVRASAVIGMIFGIPPVEENETSPARARDSVYRLDSVALHYGRSFWHFHNYTGIQRPAINGAFRLDQSGRLGSSARCVHRRACRSEKIHVDGPNKVAGDYDRTPYQGNRIRSYSGRALLHCSILQWAGHRRKT